MPRNETPDDPKAQEAFVEEITKAAAADVGDGLNWGAVTGAAQAVGKPPERHDLVPPVPMGDLAVLFGKHESFPPASAVDLFNHAGMHLRMAHPSLTTDSRPHLLEAARAILLMLDE